MIMEQLEARPLSKLMPNGHFTNGWWTKNHDKMHADVPRTWG
jgi:hypothetical protein